MILDLIALDNNSKIWIYQADKEFTYDELDEARPMINDFLNNWTSHQKDLYTYGNIFHRRFLTIFVDETASGASGCSIDKSVAFVEHLGRTFNKDLFSRTLMTYMDEDEEIQSIEMSDMPDAYARGSINDSTLFFDNLVKDKGLFLKHWLKPLSESWHKRFV